MRTLKITLVAALLVMAAACSDGGGDGPEVSEKGKPYVEALSKSLNDNDGDEIQVTDDQADCISTSWVDILKPERLEEKGVKPADLAEGGGDESIGKVGLSEDEGNAMVDAYGDCDIDLREAFLEGLRNDDATTEEQAKCLDGAIDEQLLRDLLVQGFTKGGDSLDQDSEAGQKFLAAISKCGTGA